MVREIYSYINKLINIQIKNQIICEKTVADCNKYGRSEYVELSINGTLTLVPAQLYFYKIRYDNLKFSWAVWQQINRLYQTRQNCNSNRLYQTPQNKVATSEPLLTPPMKRQMLLRQRSEIPFRKV